MRTLSDVTFRDAFTRAYIECAIWASTWGEDGKPLDHDFGPEDLAEETVKKILDDCAKFQEENAEDIGNLYIQAGHDFWLTRNRHGTGFWDRACYETKDARDRLTAAAHTFEECTLYPGDDDKLYLERG